MSFTDANLIAAVHNQPCIYDFTSSHYRDRMRKSSAWEEIGIELNCNIFDCQKRWKSLRDRFVKEIRNAKSLNSAHGSSRKEWYLLKTMEFLLPYIHNPVKGPMILDDLEVCEENECDKTLPISPPGSVDSEVGDMVNSASKKRKRKHLLETFLVESIQRKSELENDEDRLFLLSLAPAMKRLNPKTKSEMKMKFQRLLYDAEFDESSESEFLRIPV